MSAAAYSTRPRATAWLARIGHWLRRPSRPAAGELGGNDRSQIDLADQALAAFCHDLRNQLMIILACAEDVRRLTPPGPADEPLTELTQRVERASDLTREFLTAARLRSQARVVVDLNQILESLQPTLARLSAGRLRLDLRLAPEPITLIADRLDLERIVLNLVINARDATAGHGVVSITTSVLDHPARRRTDGNSRRTARLTIRDTGSGMAPDVKARMFEPFFTTKPLSTGLGLSSVAATVRHLRGIVSVESRQGIGTSVTIHLPCIVLPNEAGPNRGR